MRDLMGYLIMFIVVVAGVFAADFIKERMPDLKL